MLGICVYDIIGSSWTMLGPLPERALGEVQTCTAQEFSCILGLWPTTTVRFVALLYTGYKVQVDRKWSAKIGTQHAFLYRSSRAIFVGKRGHRYCRSKRSRRSITMRMTSERAKKQ